MRDFVLLTELNFWMKFLLMSLKDKAENPLFTFDLLYN